MGDGWGFYRVGWLGVAVSVLGVGLSSLALGLDFDHVQQAVRRGMPARESWQLSAGLIATVVWLYLEIVRLLSLLSAVSDDD